MRRMMTTNLIPSHNQSVQTHIDPMSDHLEMNDDVSRSWAWFGGFQQQGSMDLFESLVFIMVHGILNLNDRDARHYLFELCKSLGMRTTIDDERLLLQKLAANFNLSFEVWVIDPRGGYSYSLSPLTEQKSNHSYSVYLVYRKNNQTWYPLYVLDSAHVMHTSFPQDDLYIYHLHENFRQAFARLLLSDNGEQLSIQPQGEESENMDESMPAQITDQTSIQHEDECTEYSSVQLNNNSQASQPVEIPPAQMLISAHEVHMDSDAANTIQQDALSNTAVISQRFSTSNPLSCTTDIVPTSVDSSNGPMMFPPPKLRKQPKRMYRRRYLNEGLLRLLPKFDSLEFDTSDVHGSWRGDLYIGTRVCTYNHKIHKQKFAVPGGAQVDQEYENDPERCECWILHPENPDEFNGTGKNVLSKLLSTNEKIVEISIIQECQSRTITKQSIKDDKLKWFKLGFAYYRKSPLNTFHRVSPFSYSDLILETRKSQSADNPDLSLRSLCEKGGQVIPVLISEPFQENDLNVLMNDIILQRNQFEVEKNILSFVSPAGIAGTDLQVVISKRTDEQLLQNWKMTYQTHGDHDEPCDAYKH